MEQSGEIIMEKYKRIVTCELCGQQFEIENKHVRSRRCPDCRMAIRGEIRRCATRTRRKKPLVSKLDTLAREARECGLSYGKYVALKKAGFKIKPMKQVVLARREEGWIAELYAIVAAGRRRAKEKTR